MQRPRCGTQAVGLGYYESIRDTIGGSASRRSLVQKLLSAILLSFVLGLTINSESLWTDEAFSAFIASHRSIATCWSTLAHGDSSDLQMVLYYLFLHAWTSVFGQSEIALRTANLPFIVLFSGVLVWASDRLFRSRWVWLIAALAPLAVAFASDTRPYFDVIALSLTSTACLLAYLQRPSPRERQVLPWLILIIYLAGVLFHMLMLLLAGPLALLVLLISRTDEESFRWRDWKRPVIVLLPFAAALAVYLAWTFHRGTAYDYAKPELLSMGSVLFRFVGLSGYSPNRHYDISFRPYLASMGIASVALVSGLVLLLYQAKSSPVVRALFFALILGLAEAAILSPMAHQQIEFRHLSSLLPLLMLLIMAGICGTPKRTYAILAAATIGLTWLGSDVMLLFSPELKREDFRAAVRNSIALAEVSHANIAVVADPAGAAYYGLDVIGAAPCFPLKDSCQEGFAQLPWPKKMAAQFALFWSRPQIGAWLAEEKRNHVPVVVLISRSRHPMLKDSAWWPILNQQAGAKVHTEHGFFIYELPD